MKKNVSMRVLYWAPRVLGLLFAGFISLFALDVFGEGYGVWETLLALIIHLIPTAVILLVVALAWRWAWIGSLAFLGLGLGYLLVTGGQEQWLTYLFIAGPLFLLAILYFLSWLWPSDQILLRQFFIHELTRTNTNKKIGENSWTQYGWM